MTITEPPQEATAEVKRSHRRPVLAIVGGLLLVGGAAMYAAGWTGLMGVNAVEVEGVTTLSAQELIAVADIPEGTPMMRVDVRAATARLADLPQLSSVDVHREWPRTVVLSVSERGAVAVQKESDGWELLDDKGVPFAVVPDRPKDLPTVARSQDEATNTAMLAALAQMSPQLRARIAEISAASSNDIRLTLRKSDAVVKWGSADESEYKSAVLLVLLEVDAGWFDVSNPDTPTSAQAEPRPAPVDPDAGADPAASPDAVESTPPIETEQPAETPQSQTAQPEPTVAESPVGVVPQNG